MTVNGGFRSRFISWSSRRSSCRSAATWRACSRASVRFSRPCCARSSGALPHRRRRRDARAALDDLYGRHAAVQCGRVSLSFTRCSACRRMLPFNPAGPIGRRARPGVQHRGQLHHQHQLAELRRRDHDELSHADGRADDAQLHVGRHRHRAGRRADPRLCARLGARRSAISGSI